MSPKPKGENNIGGSTFPETTSPTTPKSSEKPLEGDELGSSVSVEAAVAVEPAIGVNPLIAGSMTVFALGLMTKILSSILLGKKTSVVKLQVGLSRTVESVQRDLNQMAKTADSTTPQGLTDILKETIQVLLNHIDRVPPVSGYSSGDAKRSMLEVEKLYNQLSFEERSKFDEETRVNIRKKSATTKSYNIDHYIVITIIVAAEGVHKLPPIKSDENLTKALQELWNIPSIKQC